MKYVLFEQNANFVLFVKEGEVPPTLSAETLLELDLAYANAVFNRDGWTLFDGQIKKALVQRRLVIKLIRDESKDEGKLNPVVWEAIKFLNEWVRDVHPFRDNLPD